MRSAMKRLALPLFRIARRSHGWSRCRPIKRSRHVPLVLRTDEDVRIIADRDHPGLGLEVGDHLTIEDARQSECRLFHNWPEAKSSPERNQVLGAMPIGDAIPFATGKGDGVTDEQKGEA